MKKTLIGGLMILVCGCESMNNTQASAVGGGLLGGGIGALFGAACGRPLAGAAIGAGIGAGTGALVGHGEDRREARADARAQAIVNATSRPPLTLQDVVYLSQQHVPPDMIIQQMQTTGSFYRLTADDLIYLRGNGVSDQVIAVMQTRQPVVVAPAQRVYVYDPYPPPPVGIGVGVGVGHRW